MLKHTHEFADEKVIQSENCARVLGLETVPGIFLICTSSCYFIANFRLVCNDENGDC